MFCIDSGNRFIITSGSIWMREFAQTLEREFKSQGMRCCMVECTDDNSDNEIGL